jgi:hypothetical protein
MRAIDFSHKNTPNESFWRKFFEKFSPKNYQLAVFLGHSVAFLHHLPNKELYIDVR